MAATTPPPTSNKGTVVLQEAAGQQGNAAVAANVDANEALQAPNSPPQTGATAATAAVPNNTANNNAATGFFAANQAQVRTPNLSWVKDPYTLAAAAIVGVPTTVLCTKEYYGALEKGFSLVLDRLDAGAKSFWKTAFITIPLGGLVISWMVRYPSWANRENVFHQQEINQGLSVSQQERNSRRRKLEMTFWLLGEVALVLALSFSAKLMYDYIILSERFYAHLLPMPDELPKDNPQISTALETRPKCSPVHPMTNNLPVPVTVVCKHRWTGANTLVQTLQPGESVLAKSNSMGFNLIPGVDCFKQTITTDVILPNQVKGSLNLPHETAEYIGTSSFFSKEQLAALGVSMRVIFPN